MSPLEIADQRVLEARDRERDRWVRALHGEQLQWILRRGTSRGQLQALQMLAARLGAPSVDGMAEHEALLKGERQRLLVNYAAVVMFVAVIGAIMFGGAQHMGREQPFGRKDCVCFNVEAAP